MKLYLSLFALLLTIAAVRSSSPDLTQLPTGFNDEINYFRRRVVRSRVCIGLNITCPENHYCMPSTADSYRCLESVKYSYRPQYSPLFHTSGNLRVGKEEECREGYERTVLENQTYDYCRDFDECSEYIFICGRNGKTCYNYPAGKYTCDCNNGYVFNETTCVDKNECEDKPRVCAHICTNTEGSYSCSCREGFIKSENESSNCFDIDECLSGTHTCQATEYCLNLSGSHECVTPRECPENYVTESKSTCHFDETLGVRPTGEPKIIHYKLMPSLTDTTGVVGTFSLDLDGFNATMVERWTDNKIRYQTDIHETLHGSKFTITISIVQSFEDGEEEYVGIDLITNINQMNDQMRNETERLELTVYGYSSQL